MLRTQKNKTFRFEHKGRLSREGGNGGRELRARNNGWNPPGLKAKVHIQHREYTTLATLYATIFIYIKNCYMNLQSGETMITSFQAFYAFSERKTKKYQHPKVIQHAPNVINSMIHRRFVQKSEIKTSQYIRKNVYANISRITLQ